MAKKMIKQRSELVKVIDVEKTNTTGFDRGLTVNRIIGATVRDGKTYFLIEWKNSTDIELIPAKIANSKCPQVVIAFYEKRLTWKLDPPKSSHSQHSSQKLSSTCASVTKSEQTEETRVKRQKC